MSDAINKPPTLDEQVAEFKGFATTDGEVSDGKQTSEEAAALAEREKIAEASEEKPTQQKADGDNAAESEAEDAEDADEEAEQPEAKPGKMSAKDRVKQAVSRQRAAERYQAAAEERATALETRLAALEKKGSLTPEQEASKSKGDELPKPEDFEHGELDSRYIRALARFETLETLKANQAKQQATQQREADEVKSKEFEEQRQAFDEAGAAEFEDFDDVVLQGMYDKNLNPDGWVMSKVLGDLVLGSEVGHRVARHLARNPKESREVYGKTAMQQAAYFGRLEAKFSSPSASDANPGKEQKPADNGQAAPKPPVKTSQAPPPMKGGRGSTGRTQVSPATTDFAAFEELARADSRS